MTLFVIADKQNCCYPIDVAQEWMLEDELSQALVAMGGAESFQSSSGAIKVFDNGILIRGVKWLHGLWGFHPNEPRGNDCSRYQPAKESDPLRRTRDAPSSSLITRSSTSAR